MRRKHRPRIASALKELAESLIEWHLHLFITITGKFGKDFRASVSDDHQGFYGERSGVKFRKEVGQNFLPGHYLCLYPCKSPGIKMQTTQPSNAFPSCIVCLMGEKNACFSPPSDILKVIICHAHILI